MDKSKTKTTVPYLFKFRDFVNSEGIMLESETSFPFFTEEAVQLFE